MPNSSSRILTAFVFILGLVIIAVLGLSFVQLSKSPQQFIAQVGAPPTLTFSAIPTAVSPSGGSSRLQWTAVNATSCDAAEGWSGTKPTTGSEQVTPTVSRTYVLVCTGAGGSVERGATVTVIGTSPVIVTTPSLPAGRVGQSYAATLSAMGGRPPYTWNVVEGILPAGLNLSSAGVFSGTPSAADFTSFTIRAADSAGEYAPQSYRFAIDPLASSPTGLIAGIAFDSLRTRGVAGAAVEITPGNYAATTRSDGTFFVNDIPPGAYTVRITTPRFEQKTISSVIVEAGETTPVTAWLFEPGFVTTQGDKFSLNGREITLVGTWYFPSYYDENWPWNQASWLRPERYGASGNIAQVERELTKVRDLGFNTIDIWGLDDAAHCGNLNDFLSRVKNHGLRVKNFYIGLPRGGDPLDNFFYEWTDMERNLNVLRTCNLENNDIYMINNPSWEETGEPRWARPDCTNPGVRNGPECPYAARRRNLPLVKGKWVDWVKRNYGTIADAFRNWGYTPPNPNPAATDASCVRHTIPERLLIGNPYANLTLTVKNVGGSAWSGSSYRLFPLDVSLPGVIAPNQEATFTFAFTPPNTPGPYTVPFQVTKDGQPFGDLCGVDTEFVTTNPTLPPFPTTAFEEKPRLYTPTDDQICSEGDWRPYAVAFRYFMNEELGDAYRRYRARLKSVDPNHLFGSHIGSPTPEWNAGCVLLDYDKRQAALAKYVDVMPDEGNASGSILGEEGFRRPLGKGGFNTAYLNLGKPYDMVEIGMSNLCSWPSGFCHKDTQATFYHWMFDTVMKEPFAGLTTWWFTGAQAENNGSDWGIVDRLNLREYPAANVTRARGRDAASPRTPQLNPTPQVVDPDAYASLTGYYRLQGGQEVEVDRGFYGAERRNYVNRFAAEGMPHRVVTVCTGKTSADPGLDIQCAGNAPNTGSACRVKCLAGRFLTTDMSAPRGVEIKNENGNWVRVSDGGSVTVRAGAPIEVRTTIENITETAWASAAGTGHVNIVVEVVPAGGGTSALTRVPLASDVNGMSDYTAQFTVSGVSQPSTATFFLEASGRTSFGERTKIRISTGVPPPPALQPAAPSELAATAVSQTQINLTWTDNASNETGFRVERSQTGTPGSFSVIPAAAHLAANTTAYGDTGLAPNTAYHYRVIAFNAVGDSDPSPVASATTQASSGFGRPAAPSELAAQAESSRQIRISWRDNSENETGFIVERSLDGVQFTRVVTVGRNVVTYVHANLTPRVRYYYRVLAYNRAGNSAYAPPANTVTSDVIPASPSSLTGVVLSSSSIRLTWRDRATNEAGFKLERKKNGENFSEIGTPGENSTTIADTLLTPATTYYYRIRAWNSIGVSGYSNTLRVVTRDIAPREPANVSAIAVSPTIMRLTWEDRSANENGFKIERSLDGASFSQISYIHQNRVNFVDRSVRPNTVYFYRMRAWNREGDSNYTDVVQATTPDIPPRAPSSLAGTPLSSNTIRLTWRDNATNETGFKIERRIASALFEEIAVVDQNRIEFLDTPLSPNIRYSYRIRAFNSAGSSSYSPTIYVQTRSAP